MERFKKFLRPVRQSALVTLTMLLLCGLVFPLLLHGISAVVFPEQAAGSPMEMNGETVGFAHVGQEFTEPYFMKGRPSAVHYNTYLEQADGEKVYADGSAWNGLASGSSNYGASNPALTERIEADIEAFLAANPTVSREDIPADLVTASGSGLDPHISPAAAEIQIPAIAEASGLSEDVLRQIVADNTEGKGLGLFGEETVHVLGVNIAIAEAMQAAEGGAA